MLSNVLCKIVYCETNARDDSAFGKAGQKIHSWSEIRRNPERVTHYSRGKRLMANTGFDVWSKLNCQNGRPVV